MSALVEADEQGIMRFVNAQWSRAAEQYACRMQKYVWRNRIASEREKNHKRKLQLNNWCWASVYKQPTSMKRRI